MSKAISIAQYIVWSFTEKGLKLTPLKLQKILYYVKVWGLVSNNDVAKGYDFRAWKHGPVNVEVYHSFRQYGSSPVSASSDHFPMPSDEEKRLIDFVIRHYGKKGAIELSSMTHAEDPWKNTPRNQVISEDSLYDFYSSTEFAKNFPLPDEETRSIFISSSSFDCSFSFDMDRSVDMSKWLLSLPAVDDDSSDDNVTKWLQELQKQHQKASHS